MNSPFRDIPQRNRFELELDGDVAFATYKRADGVLTIFHTEVPEHLRNRGAGGKMVRAVLDYARAEGLKVRPLCPFVKAYIDRHPADKDLLA